MSLANSSAIACSFFLSIVVLIIILPFCRL
jgi:hypothetical protein